MEAISYKDREAMLINIIRWAERVKKEAEMWSRQYELFLEKEQTIGIQSDIYIGPTIRNCAFQLEDLIDFCKSEAEQLQPEIIKMIGDINLHDIEEGVAIDAYDQLSSSWTFTWDELDNLKEKLNWDLVSSNPFIKWSIEMIESFEDKINWSLLSKNINSDSMRDEVFERFAGRWDWKQLSWNSNLCISEKLIEKYKDRWDWKGIIHYFRTSFPAKDFLEKYKDFIPQEIPRRSGLYAQLVYDYKNKLLNKDSDY